ncbi:MAG: hypothetical protein JW841_09165, partial [Deltaproteobacteria bacterium]|nr:hypothetical protein [Deltaproteobacteria bacterium]
MTPPIIKTRTNEVASSTAANDQLPATIGDISDDSHNKATNGKITKSNKNNVTASKTHAAKATVTVSSSTNGTNEVFECPVITVNPISINGLIADYKTALDPAFTQEAPDDAAKIRFKRAQDELLAIMAAAEHTIAQEANQIPQLDVGQGIIWRSGEYFGSDKDIWQPDGENIQVLYRISSIDADGVVLELINGNSPPTEVDNYLKDKSGISPIADNPRAKKYSRAALTQLLSIPSLSVHKSTDVTSTRVPSPAAQASMQCIQAYFALVDLQLQERLGSKNYTIYKHLEQQKLALATDLDNTQRALEARLNKDSGIQSNLRLSLSPISACVSEVRDLLELNNWVNRGYSPQRAGRFEAGLSAVDKYAGDPKAAFKATAHDPELLGEASERQVIARLEHTISAIDTACERIADGKSISPKTVEVDADPVLRAMAEFAVSNDKQISHSSVLATRISYIQKRAKEGRVGDALLVYQATMHSYLSHKSSNNESFHYTSDGKGSLLLAIHTVLLRHNLTNRRLVLSSRELSSPKIRRLAISHWGEIEAVYQALHTGAGEAEPDIFMPYDVAAFEAEVSRLQRIERDGRHAELQKIINRENIDEALDAIKAAEPSYAAQFGMGVLRILDSPQLVGMVAVGTATSGLASGLLLGKQAVSAAELLNLARNGAFGLEALSLCTLGVTYDGISFLMGMNVFNWAIGEYELIDFSIGGYFRSILMMGIVQLAAARHVQRVYKAAAARSAQSTQAHLARNLASKAGEGARYFTEEAICLGAIDTIALLQAQGNLDGLYLALEHTVQFLLAMRLAHGVQRAVGLDVRSRRQGVRYQPNAAEVRAFAVVLEAMRECRNNPSTTSLARMRDALTAYFKTLAWREVPVSAKSTVSAELAAGAKPTAIAKPSASSESVAPQPSKPTQNPPESVEPKPLLKPTDLLGLIPLQQQATALVAKVTDAETLLLKFGETTKAEGEAAKKLADTWAQQRQALEKINNELATDIEALRYSISPIELMAEARVLKADPAYSDINSAIENGMHFLEMSTRILNLNRIPPGPAIPKVTASDIDALIKSIGGEILPTESFLETPQKPLVPPSLKPSVLPSKPSTPAPKPRAIPSIYKKIPLPNPDSPASLAQFAQQIKELGSTMIEALKSDCKEAETALVTDVELSNSLLDHVQTARQYYSAAATFADSYKKACTQNGKTATSSSDAFKYIQEFARTFNEQIITANKLGNVRREMYFAQKVITDLMQERFKIQDALNQAAKIIKEGNLQKLPKVNLPEPSYIETSLEGYTTTFKRYQQNFANATGALTNTAKELPKQFNAEVKYYINIVRLGRLYQIVEPLIRQVKKCDEDIIKLRMSKSANLPLAKDNIIKTRKIVQNKINEIEHKQTEIENDVNVYFLIDNSFLGIVQKITFELP